MVGQMLGHYRLITKIGEGGMGVVYRAHDEHLHRDVALKVLPPGKLRDESTRRQFRKEALTLSKLNHPNVATVYDFDTQDGTDFLVLEYIPGITLSTKLAAGPLREAEIAHLGAQLAEGLEAAHRLGVIHRDLKPSNLRMDPDGRLKILDFGLARMLSPPPDAPTESLTETLAGAGTLPYMAPEQLRGSPADHRTDIYSSGVVLYEMATGRRPFDGKMPTLVSDAILHQPPAPPTTLNRRLSASLESIILKAIDKRPEQRYQSAKELQVDLKRLDDPTARLVGARKRGVARQRARTVVLAMVLLLAAVFAGVPSVRRAVQQWFTPAGNTPRVLAVLPFETIGADDQQAFSRGLSEALTAALGKLNQKYLLEVVPASEVRAQAVTNREQARKILGADLVLEGSLHFAQQARITYSLVDVRSRQQLDSGLLTVETADVFAMEDQVIDKVLAAMQIQLQSDEKSRLVARGTAQSAAYQYYLRGQGYLLACDQEPNAELAIPVFQRALQEDPNFPLAYAGLSEAYWCRYEQTKQAEWVGRATETCQRALALGAGLAPVHVACGRVSLGTGKYEDAISSYERALEIEPASDAAYQGLATSYEALGRLEDAERAYRRAITLRPDYWGVYRRAGVFYFNHGRYDDADRMFRRVIELAPENARGFSNLGGVAFAQGKWAEARRLYEKSNEIQPNYRAYSNLGTLYFVYESRYADAARAFEKALELADHDLRVWHNLAAAYYWVPGEREKAKAIYQRTAHMLEQALHVNARDPDLLIRRADCLAMLGDSAQARKLIERALRLAPDNVDILFQAGDIYENIGDRARAIEEIGKALKKGYSPEAIQRAPGLERLRSDPRFLKLWQRASKDP